MNSRVYDLKTEMNERKHIDSRLVKKNRKKITVIVSEIFMKFS